MEEELIEAMRVVVSVKAGSAIIYRTRARDAVKARTSPFANNGE